jgi:hypothetical protein
MRNEAIKSPDDLRLNDIQEEGRRDSTEEEREEARDQFMDNDIQIDDDAQVSVIEDSENVWVQAWLYVRKT